MGGGGGGGNSEQGVTARQYGKRKIAVELRDTAAEQKRTYFLIQ